MLYAIFEANNIWKADWDMRESHERKRMKTPNSGLAEVGAFRLSVSDPRDPLNRRLEIVSNMTESRSLTSFYLKFFFFYVIVQSITLWLIVHYFSVPLPLLSE